MKETLVKAYVDIDGVLLTKQMTVPDYAESFIDFLLQNFDCYWLTTHCRVGENKTIPYLQQFYHASVIRRLKQTKTTDWLTLKTEAIEMASDFIWLEDYPFEAEKLVLKQNDKSGSLFEVNLSRPQELKRQQSLLVAIW